MKIAEMTRERDGDSHLTLVIMAAKAGLHWSIVNKFYDTF